MSVSAAPMAMSAAPSHRAPAIDAARGVALLAMFVFHIVWDLAFFGVVPAHVPSEPAFRGFGHMIAAAFVFLAGVGLTLAARRGLDLRQALKRIGVIAGAAALVSIATWFIFPDAFIFFGILHLIALASLCALPFLRAPTALVALVAAAAIVAPLVYQSSVFDAPAFWWLGLGAIEPRSNDWRPFLPWFGVMLAGLLAGRAILARGLPPALAAWTPRGAAGQALVFGGRHSLAIYLVHQPVFIAAIFVATMLSGHSQFASSDIFTEPCRKQCIATGGGEGLCTRACACIADQAREKGFWRAVATNRLSPGEKTQFDEITKVCVRQELTKEPVEPMR